MSTARASLHAAGPPGDNREKLLERAMARHGYSGDALLEVLRAAQDLYGFLTPQLLGQIASKLKLPATRVTEFAKLNRCFQRQPKGGRVYVVCTGTACKAAGAHQLMGVLERRGCKAEKTSEDGKVSVAAVRCLGCCGMAPAVVKDGKLAGKLTTKTLHEDLDRIRARA